MAFCKFVEFSDSGFGESIAGRPLERRTEFRIAVMGTHVFVVSYVFRVGNVSVIEIHITAGNGEWERGTGADVTSDILKGFTGQSDDANVAKTQDCDFELLKGGHGFSRCVFRESPLVPGANRLASHPRYAGDKPVEKFCPTHSMVSSSPDSAREIKSSISSSSDSSSATGGSSDSGTATGKTDASKPFVAEGRAVGNAAR